MKIQKLRFVKPAHCQSQEDRSAVPGLRKFLYEARDRGVKEGTRVVAYNMWVVLS
jgi:hypothetical protein